MGNIPERKPWYMARELWDAPSPSTMRGVSDMVSPNSNADKTRAAIP